MYHRMKMSTRLIMLVATALLLLFSSLGIGVYELHHLKSNLAASLASARTETDAVVAVENAQAAFKTQVQEWKNILIRGNDPQSYDKYIAQFIAEEKKVQESLKNAVELMRKQEMPTADTETLLKEHEALGVKYREAIKSFDQNDPQAGKVVDAQVKGMDRPAQEGMVKVVKQIETHSVQQSSEEIARAEALYQTIRNLFILFGVIGMALLIGISTAIIRGLLGQLGGEPAYAVEITQRISEGDLTLNVQLQPGDNTSLLACMRNMQAHLRTMIGQVHANAGQLTDVAGTLASSAAQVAVSSNHQSEAAASTAAAVEEMTTNIDHVSSNAGEAHAIAKRAGELSVQGGSVVHDAVVEMSKIADAVNQSAQFIQTLGEHSNQISAIVNTIKDIADQTNLLALNAAIEAARAGEQGRGFAVVADEVRKLAERTTQSTQEISGMIDTIQSGTQNAIASMAEGSQRVAEGVAMANRAGESMEQIRDGADQVVSEVNDITAALREQGAASHQVAQNVEKIAQMTEENSAAVGEVADASHHVKHLAEQLQGSVSRFRV
ncbi:MAG: methyl-accepting chemotaxis protein [Sulfuricellaceae bacterium]